MSSQLEKLSISYFDSFGFEDMGYVFWIKAPAPIEMTKISFQGVVHVNFSRDLLDLDPVDIIVFEICHEFRQINIDDLQSYQYSIDEKFDFPKLHLITFHATNIIKIICKSVKIEHLNT
ncbi:hypothetical protein [Synechococcus sp. PCC 7336]|uniref:hypothetical protein n=1 Tax=Synechococcus sp. PCC 7336 TaxID=195250 RepID=UPI000344DC18|nr:hypothetical protein [Synechococcus sp. PCC 7336]